MSVPPQALLHAPAVVRLLSGLTGLHLAMVPAPSPGRAWDIRRLISGCRAQASRTNGARRHSRCESCAQSHLRRALAVPRLGHDFEGPCGVRSYLLPVTGSAGPVGLLALRRGPESGRRSVRPVEARDGYPEAVFRRAMRLLQPLACQTTWGAAGDGFAARLASVDGVHAPAGGTARAESAPPSYEARSRRAVSGLIEQVRREFAEPLQLKKLARESGFNASYLSTVFARQAGLSFKAYLTALRLEHAQVLLGDPRLPISRVATSVGYASPHRFRAAFRASTGLSPRRWRAEHLVKRGS